MLIELGLLSGYSVHQVDQWPGPLTECRWCLASFPLAEKRCTWCERIAREIGDPAIYKVGLFPSRFTINGCEVQLWRAADLWYYTHDGIFGRPLSSNHYGPFVGYSFAAASAVAAVVKLQRKEVKVAMLY